MIMVLYVYMNVLCKLIFVKVCFFIEFRGRIRRVINVSMVEFLCCWNYIYIDMIKLRLYCLIGFFCRLSVIFFS